jgi:hypothetical protein
MNGPDILAALDDLLVLQRGDVAGISMQEAVEVCCLTMYIICYIIRNNGCFCLGWILTACQAPGSSSSKVQGDQTLLLALRVSSS